MFVQKRGVLFWKLGNDNSQVLSSTIPYAVKILNEVKASYNAFAKRDFDIDNNIFNDYENESKVINNFNDINIAENKVEQIQSLDEYDTNSTDLTNSQNDIPESNCLALVVRKDYSLTIVKNIFTTTGRLSWKIALITGIINILNMLF